MRVVVADPTPHVRSALQLLLEQQPGVTCVAELATADRLLAVLASVAADVVLVDTQVPNGELSCLITALREAYPRLRVVVLSARPEERERALAAGADAFVRKGDALEGLLESLSSAD